MIVYLLLYVHIHIYLCEHIIYFFHLGEETYNLSYLEVTRDLTVKR